MDPLRRIAEGQGVFLTREALALGYDEKAITRAVRARRWRRVRRGAYVPMDVWLDADEVGRHLITAKAVHRSYGDKVAFSHITAALMLGIDVWGLPLNRVHVTRLDGRPARVEPDLVHHHGYAGVLAEVGPVDGRIVVPPARAALQVGLFGSTESALVSLDSVLARGLATSDELGNLYELVQQWPNARRLQVALRMADGGAKSVGESRCRWMFRSDGLPAPELQVEVRDHAGGLLGITDFGWRRHRMLGEFDGRMKYGRLLRPGQSPGDAVFAEKVREDAIRAASHCGMFRAIWADLDQPRATCARLRRLLALAG